MVPRRRGRIVDPGRDGSTGTVCGRQALYRDEIPSGGIGED